MEKKNRRICINISQEGDTKLPNGINITKIHNGKKKLESSQANLASLPERSKGKTLTRSDAISPPRKTSVQRRSQPILNNSPSKSSSRRYSFPVLDRNECRFEANTNLNARYRSPHLRPFSPHREDDTRGKIAFDKRLSAEWKPHFHKVPNEPRKGAFQKITAYVNKAFSKPNKVALDSCKGSKTPLREQIGNSKCTARTASTPSKIPPKLKNTLSQFPSKSEFKTPHNEADFHYSGFNSCKSLDEKDGATEDSENNEEDPVLPSSTVSILPLEQFLDSNSYSTPSFCKHLDFTAYEGENYATTPRNIDILHFEGSSSDMQDFLIPRSRENCEARTFKPQLCTQSDREYIRLISPKPFTDFNEFPNSTTNHFDSRTNIVNDFPGFFKRSSTLVNHVFGKELISEGDTCRECNSLTLKYKLCPRMSDFTQCHNLERIRTLSSTEKQFFLTPFVYVCNLPNLIKEWRCFSQLKFFDVFKDGANFNFYKDYRISFVKGDVTKSKDSEIMRWNVRSKFPEINFSSILIPQKRGIATMFENNHNVQLELPTSTTLNSFIFDCSELGSLNSKFKKILVYKPRQGNSLIILDLDYIFKALQIQHCQFSSLNYPAKIFAKFHYLLKIGIHLFGEQLNESRVRHSICDAMRLPFRPSSTSVATMAKTFSYDHSTTTEHDAIQSLKRVWRNSVFTYEDNDSDNEKHFLKDEEENRETCPIVESSYRLSSFSERLSHFGEYIPLKVKEISVTANEQGIISDAGNNSRMGIFSRREISSNFGVSRHRRVEPASSAQLGAGASPTQLCKKEELFDEDGAQKKTGEGKIANFFESNVLRKVANITMERNSVDKSPTKKINIPFKLDFRNCEKFEGHSLVNWLLSELDEGNHQRHSVVQLEVRQLIIEFCTMLLHAGVIRPVEDPNINGVDMNFKMEILYHWSSNESAIRQSSLWAPPLPIEIQGSKVSSKQNETDFQQVLCNLKKDHNDALEKLKTDYEDKIFKIRGEYGEKICQLEERLANLSNELESFKERCSKVDPPPYISPPAPTLPASIPPPPPPLPSSICQPIPPPPPLVSFGSIQDGISQQRLTIPSPPPPGPNPLPPPPPGGIDGWNAQTAAARKSKIVPRTAMKPLYWTRIQTLAGYPGNPNFNKYKDSIWEILEEVKPSELNEFEEKFSRQSTQDKPKLVSKSEKPGKQQVAKLLDPKRSQNLGILISSQHLEISEIEQALLNFDTDIVSLEMLKRIYGARATDEELQMIKAHIESQVDVPLDKPEQFLYDLSCIAHFEERMFCLMFQDKFNEGVSSIQSILDNMQSVCDILFTSEGVKRVLGIILALGNYMNGGNVQRGQADGFSLDILPKLKDVKSRDNASTLLHFVVSTYMQKFGQNPEAPNPLPEPGDIDKAALIKFEDVDKDLKQLRKELDACDLRAKKVIASSSKCRLQPFKDIMEGFFGKAQTTVSSTEEHLLKCRDSLYSVTKYYTYPAKNGELDPKDFFCIWSPFCNDFKAIWTREKNKIMQERLRLERVTKHKEKLSLEKVDKKPAGKLKTQSMRLAMRTKAWENDRIHDTASCTRTLTRPRKKSDKL
ncbi:uncharacterized protein LOC136030141 isoform X2 [Artemia franciscana]|uniref:uncharacterized protein LOC136030141 isoform X2 n=1 Tax=Artemia franciscana TaxID=6661 RepID=UPI0032DAAAF1